MNIYLHELRSYRRNTIVWLASISLVTLFFFALFPAFARDTDALIKVFEAYPKAVQDALGVPVELIGTVPGFYSFILTFIMLCGAVQAMNLGISVVAKETTGKTADFLLTKPVTRARVVTAKLLAVFTCIVLTSAVYLGIATATAEAVKNQPFDYTVFLMMSLSFFFIQVMFLALGFAAAVVIPKIKSVLPVSLSTVFGFFVIGTVAATLNLKELYYLSPFKYFDAAYIIGHSAYRISYAAAGAAFVAAAVILSYVIYSKKDIHTA